MIHPYWYLRRLILRTCGICKFQQQRKYLPDLDPNPWYPAFLFFQRCTSLHIWISHGSYLGKKKISTLAHSNLALPCSKNVRESQPNFHTSCGGKACLQITMAAWGWKWTRRLKLEPGLNYLLKFHNVARPGGARQSLETSNVSILWGGRCQPLPPEVTRLCGFPLREPLDSGLRG